MRRGARGDDDAKAEVTMNWEGGGGQTLSLPRPGRGLKALMIALLAVWLMFAAAINWAGAEPGLFMLFTGSVEGIASGQLWRLFTAPFLHLPNDPFHVVGVLIGLYFLTPSLEERWGTRRLMLFLAMSAVFAYAVQFVVLWLAPVSFAAKLSMGFWCGGFPAIEAVAVAWALAFRGQTVRLFLVLPVTSRGMLLFIVGLSFLRLVALQQTPEGLIAPFGGLLAGWLFGGGTPSPARRLYLRFRYSQLKRQSRGGEARGRRGRGKGTRLSVIEGGRSSTRKGDDGPPGGYLN